MLQVAGGILLAIAIIIGALWAFANARSIGGILALLILIGVVAAAVR